MSFLYGIWIPVLLWFLEKQPKSPANFLGWMQNIEIQNTKCSVPSIGHWHKPVDQQQNDAIIITSFPEWIMNLVLDLKSGDEILWYDHSNETSLALL